MIFCDAHLHIAQVGRLADFTAYPPEGGTNRADCRWYACTCSHTPQEFLATEALLSAAGRQSSPGRILLAFGLHPQAPRLEHAAFLEQLAQEGRIQAVGEAGFDLFTPEYRALLPAPVAEEEECILEQESWTNADIAAAISQACARRKAPYAVFAWADCPFLNLSLTGELVRILTEYKAEYSFADGFAYGLGPEVIDGGTAGIIATLGKDSQKAAGSRRAERDALFAIMSGDINSFEIETHIADKDYRLLRLSFDCGSKATALGCSRLYQAAKAGGVDMADLYALSDLAEKSAPVLQTLPAFFNVQIAGSYKHRYAYVPEDLPSPSDMDADSFSALVKDLASVNPRAVVSLSLFGEPLLHPRFADCVEQVLGYPELSLFIETDGTLVTPELAARLSALDGGRGAERMTWCLLLDAVDGAMYGAVHGISDGDRAAADFAAACRGVEVLASCFPHHVYPQFTRMKANEAQLETFYRYWKKSDSPSQGELIIQKYDRFCGKLPDAKSADLSPLNRFPCWHLRRDLCILSDGSVPFCRSAAFSGSCDKAGNVLKEGVEAVWERFRGPLEEQIQQSYNEMCKVCDEYYTFNF